ncbi:MAG: NAD-dependent epimerase/dehydratase family protein [Pseudomonadota bacterium]
MTDAPIDLVTGGAGFVGRRLVSALRAAGRRVRVLDLVKPKTDVDEFLVGSISDVDRAAAAVADVETVYHLAGLADLWRRNPEDFDAVNHQGTRVMLGAAASAGVKRFVHCSSATTLVGVRTPLGPSAASEASAIAVDGALGAYPRSKVLAEAAVMQAVDKGLDAVIVHPTEPLGAGDEGLTPPTKMILDFVNKKTPASIDCMLNFVSLDDLAAGFMAAAAKGRSGERYLLAGENVPMAELLETITRLTGVATPKAQLPYILALAVGAVDTHVVARVTGKPPTAPLTGVRLAGRRVAFNASKAAEELNWRAGPFEPALREMLDWARGSKLIP